MRLEKQVAVIWSRVAFLLVVLSCASSVAKGEVTSGKGSKGPAVLTLENIQVSEAGNVTMPLTIETGGNDIIAIDMEITYDPDRLTFVEPEKGSSAPSEALIVFHVNEPGKLKGEFASAYPVTADGTLLKLTFDPSGSTETATSVSLKSVSIHEGAIDSEVHHGSVTWLKFIRGDGNGDGLVELSDAVVILMFLFQGSSADCEKALDANGSGAIDISDAVFLLNYLFASGDEPRGPFPMCGLDPQADELSCFSSPVCR